MSVLRWTAAGRSEKGRGMISVSCRALRLEGNAWPSLLASPGCSSCARVMELSSGRGRAVSCQCRTRTVRFSLCIKNRAQTRGEINPRTEQDGFVVAFGNTVETCVVMPCFLSCWVWKPAKKSQRRVPCCC